MKISRITGLFVGMLMLASCGRKVELSVFNNSEIDRVNELVEICLCSLKEFDPAKIVVFDVEGNQMPCQLLYKGADEPQALVFPVSLKAGVQASYFVKEGQPLKLASKTDVRMEKQRKDVLFWKNDRIGFRMNGSGSAILVDYGIRMSDYGFKTNSLGAGGLCPYSNDSLWIPRPFDRCRILDNGPLRSTFVLYYDSIRYGGKKLKAELMISLDAGSSLNEAVIMYKGDTSSFRLATGLDLHDSIQSRVGNAGMGYIGYAEDVYTQDLLRKPLGRSYTGIIFPDRKAETKLIKGHFVGIFDYKVGEAFRYYFGAGRSKRVFNSDSDWFRYLSETQTALLYPLKIKMLK